MSIYLFLLKLKMIKKDLVRQTMIEKRNRLNGSDVESLSMDIAGSAYSFIKDNFFKNVAAYMSVKNEVKIEYITKLDSCGSINFYFPYYAKDKYICFKEFENIGLLEKDDYGVPCPIGGDIADINKIESFFVPGVAFDSYGNRVGYGKGCYDKVLNQALNSVLIGVCYDFQLISDDILEFNVNDVKMHYLLTEKGFMKANN